MKYTNMEKYNPIKVVSAIQKLKFKYATVPIIMVLVSFALSKYLGEEISKYLSLAGLILYFSTTMLFKVNRRLQIPEAENLELVFPVSGRISALEDGYVIIKKSWFGLADIRWSGTDFQPENISGKAYVFDSEPSVIGQLIGVVPFSAEYKFHISSELAAQYKIGDSVNAGAAIN